MTTILWDGKDTLYTDTRSTVYDAGKAKQRIATASDQRQKLFTDFNEKSLFRDERILMMAGSGRRLMSLGAAKAYREGKDYLKMIRDGRNYGLHQAGGFRLIVVTDKNIWEVDALDDHPHVYKRGMDEPFAVGSGGDVALYLYRNLKVPATLAIAATENIDPATGGTISYAQRLPDGDTFKAGPIQTAFYPSGDVRDEMVSLEIGLRLTSEQMAKVVDRHQLRSTPQPAKKAAKKTTRRRAAK